MAYTLRQIDEFRLIASPEEWLEVQRRQSLSLDAFKEQGLVMPYWGNLWLLRHYQNELGHDVPWVAPSQQSPA